MAYSAEHKFKISKEIGKENKAREVFSSMTLH